MDPQTVVQVFLWKTIAWTVVLHRCFDQGVDLWFESTSSLSLESPNRDLHQSDESESL